ncbi:MAG: hypothetical protein KF799_07290 [Bdellovibrionales bacterium]|nr:hypothetical protein [Bdellovibrionales bacterium]
MDRWLAQFSKNTIAFVAIVGGILFIVLTSPPHSVCDSQIEVIKEAQKAFLYTDPKSKLVKTTKYQTLRDRCKATNNPGGCYELFQNMKVLLQDLSAVPSECGSAVGGVTEVNRALWETAELLVRLAWGEKPPASYHQKFGWLDAADINLFCKLKARITYLYGEPAWNSFREKMMAELPGARDLNRNQVWEMILFSENCARYP